MIEKEDAKKKNRRENSIFDQEVIVMNTWWRKRDNGKFYSVTRI